MGVIGVCIRLHYFGPGGVVKHVILSFEILLSLSILDSSVIPCDLLNNIDDLSTLWHTRKGIGKEGMEDSI